VPHPCASCKGGVFDFALAVAVRSGGVPPAFFCLAVAPAFAFRTAGVSPAFLTSRCCYLSPCSGRLQAGRFAVAVASACHTEPVRILNGARNLLLQLQFVAPASNRQVCICLSFRMVLRGGICFRTDAENEGFVGRGFNRGKRFTSYSAGFPAFCVPVVLTGKPLKYCIRLALRPIIR
jgi:hypothetical protein